MEHLTLIPIERLDSLQANLDEIKSLIKERNHLADLKKWHSKQEARIKLNVCMKTFDNYLAKGIIPYSRFAGKIYIKASDIEAHLQRNYISK
jgi:hypothetical protein